MEKGYVTLFQGNEGYYEEKKSRFLSLSRHVESVEEADAFLSEIRKKYYDASHHCYAYILGRDSEIQKASDDGEPSQTAGLPILSVLQGAGVTNVCTVVTRYFGGTLLGTGGLVRSYTKAAKSSLENSVLMREYPADEVHVRTDYTGLGKLQYFFGSENITPAETVYDEAVSFMLAIPVEDTDHVIAKMTDLTNGKAAITKLNRIWRQEIIR